MIYIDGDNKLNPNIKYMIDNLSVNLRRYFAIIWGQEHVVLLLVLGRYIVLYQYMNN